MAEGDVAVFADMVQEITEPLRVFRESPFARSLHDVLEPLGDALKGYDPSDWTENPSDRPDWAKQFAGYAIKRVKYALYWLEHDASFKNEEGRFVFGLRDMQAVEALHLAVERALRVLSKQTKNVVLLHEGDLWTPDTIPERVLITLNEVSRNLLEALAATPPLLHSLSPRKFEEVVAKLLEDDGFDVQLTPASRDGGRDILAYIDLAVGRILTLVECKKWSKDRKIPVDLVRQLYGVLNAERATNAMLVTTSTFTQDAGFFVNSLKYQLTLRDYNGLAKWLRRYR